MIYRGDNYHNCVGCKHILVYGDIVTRSKWGYRCQKCSERENMPNIKITAEVDGKIVPLSTISTGSFEAIKALEKPKEIPVARVGNYIGNPSDRRLFLKISPQLRETITRQQNVKMVAIELKKGCVNMTWVNISGDLEELYENIRPL